MRGPQVLPVQRERQARLVQRVVRVQRELLGMQVRLDRQGLQDQQGPQELREHQGQLVALVQREVQE